MFRCCHCDQRLHFDRELGPAHAAGGDLALRCPDCGWSEAPHPAPLSCPDSGEDGALIISPDLSLAHLGRQVLA